MFSEGLRNWVFECRSGFRGYPVSFGEFTFRLDASLRRWDAASESTVREVLMATIKPGFTVVDIGANFGMHSLVAAHLVGEEGRVLAFEPIPGNTKLLRRHASLNGVSDRLVVEEAAVSNFDALTIEMMAPPEAISVTASLHWSDAGARAITVPNLRLNDYAGFFEHPPDLIKIDVEGAELDVLNGGKRLLLETRPILLVEVHPRQLEAANTRPAEVESLLADIGYRFERLEMVEPGREFHLLCHAK